MKMQNMKAGLITLALLASSGSQAQSSVSSPNVPTLSTGRTFHCILVVNLPRSVDAGRASCRLPQSVLADDRKTVAIEAGSWLNGTFDGDATVLWQSAQTGEQVGSLIYTHPDGMVSKVRGAGHAGDRLLVTVRRAVSFPKPQSNQD